MAAKKRETSRKRNPTNKGDESAAPQKPMNPDAEYRFPTKRIPLIILFLVISLGGTSVVLMMGGRSDIEELGFEIVAEYNHKTDAFTQGLIYDGKYLYESTGNPKNYPGNLQSSIRKLDLETGEGEIKLLDEKYFAEGLTMVDNRLIQITYKKRKGFVYDLDLNKIEEFDYDFAEGWGLTYDGKHLIVSDGTDKLRFLDPKTYKVVKELTVRTGKYRLARINELEFIGGKIYANKWQENYIYVIDPETGQVEARINLEKLVPEEHRFDTQNAVLNGIAFNSKTGNLIVTGKLWPKVYEIKLKEL